MSDSDVLITVGGAFAASFLVMYLASEATSRKKMQRISAAVLGSDGHKPATKDFRSTLADRWSRSKFASVLKTAADKLQILKGNDAQELSNLLASAGYSGREAILTYASAKLVVTAIGLAILMAWATISYTSSNLNLVHLAGALALALFTMRLPDSYLKLVKRTRQDAIRRGFPQMIELVTIASEAGLGPSPAMLKAADEQASYHPELANEIRQLVNELSVLPDRSLAYERFATRVDLPEARFFSMALLQAELFGSPISQSLRNMMRDLRAMRIIAIEERANRLPVLMTLPLIMFIMPALFVVILGPAGLDIADNIFLITPAESEN